ncbi:hypothetical protein EYF80_012605 [Liparis tanakae]|uniref:Uncharacterized protein n=1 Tax=Liparis tanakae TaxID=230148 RepID=A0A4Z2IGK3_9TELE|nr:hypothetical protein EYF80_012605 [Liparis tanakae]
MVVYGSERDQTASEHEYIKVVDVTALAKISPTNPNSIQSQNSLYIAVETSRKGEPRGGVANLIIKD